MTRLRLLFVALCAAAVIAGSMAWADLANIGFQQPVPHNFLNGLVQSTDLATDLRAFAGIATPTSGGGTRGSMVYVRGLASPGDTGAGVFYWDASSTATDDGGTTVIKPTSVSGAGRWLRLVLSAASVTGSLTPGNVACLTATGVVDCGVAPLGSAGAGTLLGSLLGGAASFISNAVLGIPGSVSGSIGIANGSGGGATTTLISRATGNQTVEFSGDGTTLTMQPPAANVNLQFATQGTGCIEMVQGGVLEIDIGCSHGMGINLLGGLYLSGTISPTALSGDVDDYNPTGLASVSTVKIDGGAADRNITGLSGGAEGRVLTLFNDGATNNITLKNLSGSSTASNRFSLGSDAILPVKGSISLRYDAVASVWRPTNRAALTNAFMPQLSGIIAGEIKNFNCNTTGDIGSITLSLPPGTTTWRPNRYLLVQETGTKGSETFGIYGAASQGAPILSAQASPATTAAGVNNSGNFSSQTATINGTLNYTQVFLNINAAAGGTCTQSFYLIVDALP